MYTIFESSKKVANKAEENELIFVYITLQHVSTLSHQTILTNEWRYERAREERMCLFCDVKRQNCFS